MYKCMSGVHIIHVYVFLCMCTLYSTVYEQSYCVHVIAIFGTNLLMESIFVVISVPCTVQSLHFMLIHSPFGLKGLDVLGVFLVPWILPG